MAWLSTYSSSYCSVCIVNCLVKFANLDLVKESTCQSVLRIFINMEIGARTAMVVNFVFTHQSFGRTGKVSLNAQVAGTPGIRWISSNLHVLPFLYPGLDLMMKLQVSLM